MLTELRIEGFKSFGAPAQQLALGALNFVVGANASGKTNLLSALRFLKSAVRQNAEFAVNELGGIEEVRNKLQRERKLPKPLMMSLRLDFAKTGWLKVGTAKVSASGREKSTEYQIKGFEFCMKLDLRSENKVPEVDSEELTAELKDNSGKEFTYRLKRNKREVEIVDPLVSDENHPQRIVVPEQEKARLAVGVGFFSLPSVVFRELIGQWRFYNINPHLARAPFKETPDVDLGPSGEYLSVILHKLEQQNGKKALDAIVANLRSVIPGFRDIRTKQLPVEGKWAFQVLEERIRGAINPDSVSDGTIRLLALLVIAGWAAKRSGSALISIEEPENSLHPHISEHIVGILRTVSERCQVIATTHNPTFLDYLGPEEVILCDKEDGFTRLRRASNIEEIEAFRKHYRLGELWVQGVLGGVP